MIDFNIPLPFDHVEPEGEFTTMEAVHDIGASIERAGFSSALVSDHPCPSGKWLDSGGHHAQDPFVMLSLLAAVTTRIGLQTGILVLPYRNPFIMSRAIATLDRFSHGRVTIGLGAGYLKAEFHALGVDFDKRNAYMDDYIEAMKKALTGEEFSHDGEGYEARGARIQPGPVQSPRPPLLVGGNSPLAIRRAVERADGWYPFFVQGGVSSKVTRTAEISNADDLEKALGYAREHIEKVGREEPFIVQCGSIVAPGEEWTYQSIIDAAGRFGEMGVSAAAVSIPGRTRAEWCDNVEAFGENVIAKLN